MKVEHFARVMTSPGSNEVDGTAYPLGPTRFLTAGHVARELGREMDLVWGAEQEELRCRVRCTWIRTGDVTEGDVDAAVLEYLHGDKPDGMLAFLATSPMARAGAWESQGFALAGESERDEAVWSSPVGLNGTAYPPQPDGTRFELSVEAPPDTRELWKGISGTSVFVGRTLHGLIANAAPNFDSRRLLAVPMPALLADPDFKKAAGLLQERPDFGELSRHLQKHLGEDEQSRLHLIAQQPSWDQAYQDGGCSSLVEELLATSALDLARNFDHAHAACWHGEPPQPVSASTLFEIASRLLPWSWSSRIELNQTGIGGTVLSLPVGRATAAELLMAGWDGRAFQYGGLVYNLPHPEADVGVRLGFGIDPEGTEQFRALTTRLASWVWQGDFPADRDLSIDRLVELNDEFEFLGTRPYARIRYFLVMDAQQAKKAAAFLGQIREHLSSLRVLVLDGKQDSDESSMCRNLRDLCYREQNQGKDYFPSST